MLRVCKHKGLGGVLEETKSRLLVGVYINFKKENHRPARAGILALIPLAAFLVPAVGG